MPALLPILVQVLARLLALCLIAAVEGGMMALAAEALGDDGPRRAGRLSFNPLKHIDIVGGLGLVIFGLGWIKPMRLDAAKLRFGRLGLVLVALAGLLSLLGLAGVLEVLRRPFVAAAPGGATLYLVVALEVSATLALAFPIFNLIPVHPLTGRHLLAALWPAAGRFQDRHARTLLVLVAAFVASGIADQLMVPIYRPLSRLLLGAG